MARLGVVIVGYRRYDLLARTLTSLRDGSWSDLDVVVVDNESTPQSLATLASSFPDFTYISNPSNAGFAAASNQGFRELQTDLVLFLNPDVELQPKTLELCVSALDADRSIGIVTCRLCLPNGVIDHACHRGMPTPGASLAYLMRLHRLFPTRRWAGRYTMSWLDLESDHDIEACSGAFLLIRSRLFESIGGWDEGYSFYGEDLDLCLQVQRAGLRIRYLGSVWAVHHKSATSHIRATGSLDPAARAIRARAKRQIVASHRRFFLKNLASTVSPVTRSLILLWFSAQALYVRVRYQR